MPLTPKAATHAHRPLHNLWRVREYVRPYYWPHLTVMLAGGVVEILAGILTPLITQRVVDGPVRSGSTAGLFALGGLVLLFGVGTAFLGFFKRWVYATASPGLETAIRNDFYQQLQRLPVTFHDRWQTGQLVARLTADLGSIRRFLSFGAVFLVVNIAMFATVVGLLVHLYWPLGVLCGLAAAPLAWISLRLEKQYLTISRQVQDQQGDLATFVEECAVGIRTIKSFGRRRHVSERFAQLGQQVHDTTIRKARLIARFWALFELVPNIMVGAVLVLGALAVANGRLSLGALVAFVGLVLMLVWPVDALGWLLANAQEAATAADRIYEVLDTVPEIQDRPDAIALGTVTGSLRFEGVRFAYGNGKNVLDGVDLEIRPGETLALAGATGSGKTTLTALVTRLYDVTGGRITLDGTDVRDLTLSSLRGAVGVAFEDPTLFSASVRENLTLGRPDATDDQVTEALRIAQAEFAYELPWGLDTRIGEQGLSLSGGQRQRLALARAVLGRPPVLVLDDPLSALDVHTEALVEKALASVLAGTTALLVVHRPSTVALADRVALLEDGRITAVGTHSELLATVPSYRNVLSQELPIGAES